MTKMLGKASAWNFRCVPCCLPRTGKQARKREWKRIERRLWMKEAKEEIDDPDLAEALAFWGSLKEALAQTKNRIDSNVDSSSFKT